MVRTAALALVVLSTLAGCTASRVRPVNAAAHPSPEFTTEEQKLMACLDLRDHIVEMYADEYVSRAGLAMSIAEKTAFRAGWQEELAKRGTFERFEQSCSYSLTPSEYRCGMASQSTDGVVACMKQSSG